MYALITCNPDGEIRIHSLETDECRRAILHPEEWSVRRFEGEKFLRGNPDPVYWPEGTGVLVRFQVLGLA